MKNYFSILFLLLGSFSIAQAQGQVDPLVLAEQEYQKRITQEMIDDVYIPKDLEDCFVELNRLIDDKGKKLFMSSSEKEVFILHNERLGGWIKYNWSLWRGSRLSVHFHEVGLKHPDEMSRFILVMYHRTLHGKPLDKEGMLKMIEADRIQQAKEKAERAKARASAPNR